MTTDESVGPAMAYAAIHAGIIFLISGSFLFPNTSHDVGRMWALLS